MKLHLLAAVACVGITVATGAAPQTPRPSTMIDSAALLADLKTLSADDMQGRQVETPGGEKARAFVIRRFTESGIKPIGASYEEPFTYAPRARRGAAPAATEKHGVNVVGRIEGSRQPRHYIVISAHYDHIGVRNGTVFNGADDNASGTAGLFAVAKYFSAHRPANTVIFAAFDAEEDGEFGSLAFVKSPPVDAPLIGIDLNMDMIGREPDDRLFVVGVALQPFLKPFIERIAKTAPVKLLMGHEDPAQREDWTQDSDHYSFIKAKMPALYFGVEDFEQHHNSTDDYDTMSYDFYVRAVETMIVAAKDFDAHLDELPRTSSGVPRSR
jgi:Zn-dependent M28 family amino/carboxypeptidase